MHERTNSKVTALVWSLIGAVLTAGSCRDVDLGHALGATCKTTADCREPYVCAYGTCRAECDVDRDCPGGACIVISDHLRVCTISGEGDCDAMSDSMCPPATECALDGVCRNVCDAAHPCAG